MLSSDVYGLAGCWWNCMITTHAAMLLLMGQRSMLACSFILSICLTSVSRSMVQRSEQIQHKSTFPPLKPDYLTSAHSAGKLGGMGILRPVASCVNQRNTWLHLTSYITHISSDIQHILTVQLGTVQMHVTMLCWSKNTLMHLLVHIRKKEVFKSERDSK